jgi:glycosyltransferase involved in cell wall biosynthesis
MACGTPAISFDCESGPADVIRDGVDGVLVPPGNVGALASALDELMTNQEARERMGLRAVEVQQRFGTPQILDLWDRLFSSLGVEVS